MVWRSTREIEESQIVNEEVIPLSISPHEIVESVKKLGAEDVISIVRDYEMKQIRFSNNKIDVVKEWRKREVSLFISKDKKISVSEIEVPGDELEKEVLPRIMSNLETFKPKEDYYGIPTGPFDYTEIKGIYDEKIETMDTELVDKAEGAINSALEQGVNRVAGTLYSLVEKVNLASSSGIEASEKGTEIKINVRAFLDGERSGQWLSCSRDLGGFDPERAGEIAGEMATLSKEARSGEPGKYDLLLSPIVMGNLLDYVSFATSIFYVEAGFSFLAEKLGEKIASEKVYLRDDPTIEGGLGSRKFDDEGFPTKNKYLIREGVLETYLHNHSTSKKYETNNTGNAGWISPRPFNLILEPGRKRMEEMISEIERGILVNSNWYTRFQNYRTGDFSTIFRDGVYLIEKGEIRHRLKGLRMSENFLNFLKSIEEVGREEEKVEWWEVEIPVSTPPVWARNLRVTRATK